MDQPEFIEILTHECYKVGADKVVIEFTHQPLTKIHNRYRSVNTLFDENSACHLSLGRGFVESIKDYDKYTLEEIHDLGILLKLLTKI